MASRGRDDCVGPQVSKRQRRWTSRAGQRPQPGSGQRRLRPRTAAATSAQQPASVSSDDHSMWSHSSAAAPSDGGDSDGYVAWSLTELQPAGDGQPTAEDAGEREDDEVRGDQEAVKTASSAAEESAFETWVGGPTVNSDEYDTDLEEDFSQGNNITIDSSGKSEYLFRCRQIGLTPVKYVTQHLADSSMRMRHHYIGAIGTKPLAAALKKNTVCEEVDLSDNYTSCDGAIALARMLTENLFVSNMNIADNFIRSPGAKAFASMLETNTTLKTLSLRGNQLTDSDAKLLANALKNNMSLQHLDLSYNKFGELGAIYLANGLASNQGLVDLDLSWNNICLKGGHAMANALVKNTSLEILDLSWNGLSVYCTKAFSKALKANKALKVLDLSRNNLNSEAVIQLSVGIAKNTHLESLFLELNPIGESGVLAMLKAAAVHKRLRLLSLESCMDIKTRDTRVIQCRIAEIEALRGMLITYSAGAVRYPKVNETLVTVFNRFVRDNREKMYDLFIQMDRDQSGDITLEEFKYGLKDFGLRLTNKQMDLLIEMLDSDRSGTIEFSELMRAVEQMKTTDRRCSKFNTNYAIHASSTIRT